MQEKENKFGILICLEGKLTLGALGLIERGLERERYERGFVGKRGRIKGVRPHQGISPAQVGIRRVVRNDMLRRSGEGGQRNKQSERRIF